VKLIRPLFLVALVPMLGAAMCGAPPTLAEDVATADLAENELVQLPDGKLVQAKELPTLAEYFKNAKLVRK